MTKHEIALKAVETLKSLYPDAICSLEYSDPFELLIATRLSAQCTDARVNMVTPALFQRFKGVDDFADADVEEVGEYIKSCGLYKTKAKDLVKMAQQLREHFDSKVPDSIEALTTLSGVGRKTANLIVGDVYGKPAVVVDTHCIRITKRLGLHNEKDASKIERILKALLPPEESNDFCHRLVLFGRETCTARNPKCDTCPLAVFCTKNL
ncbi:MAG: endonuclease III [Ruminococcaceae bacterium]|nr:endonuclease III [Oscillospiraceae bacterium]